MKGSYVLMLVYVDEKWKDIANNKYPLEGHIEAEMFTEDIDISCGLYGIPWGKTYYFPYEKINKGHWLVVKTEIGEDFIRTNSFYNRYKFCCGSVLHAGNLKSAAKFILKKKDDVKECLIKEAKQIEPKDVAGSKEWFKEYKLNSKRLLC